MSDDDEVDRRRRVRRRPGESKGRGRARTRDRDGDAGSEAGASVARSRGVDSDEERDRLHRRRDADRRHRGDDRSDSGSFADRGAGGGAGAGGSEDGGRPPRPDTSGSARDKYARVRKERKLRREKRRAERSRRGGGAGGFAAAAGDALERKHSEIFTPALQQELADATNAVAERAGPPEVHVIGEIVGGTKFSDGVACKWTLETGDSWKLLEGSASGQTHVIYKSAVAKMGVWAHPLDAHYVAGSVDGWPRMLVQVWQLDDYGRLELQGYGFAHVPSGAGSFDVEIPTWRPVGDSSQEMTAFFVGGVPQLKNTDMICESAVERKRIVTASSGTVHVHFDVILKDMDKHGVEW